MVSHKSFDVDADIRRAHTPPKSLYTDQDWFERQVRRVFRNTWHFLSPERGLARPGNARSVVLLEGCLDEPLLLVRDSRGDLHCLSNVCTHRASLIVNGEWTLDSLRCERHGRRFHLDGTFAYMPCCENAENFPTQTDYLPRAPAAAWHGLVFSSLEPAVAAEDVVGQVEKRLDGLGVAGWVYEQETRRDLEVDAHWMLVCESGLEKLQTHHLLDERQKRGLIDSPRSELFEHGSLQIDPGTAGDDVFTIPQDHPDHGCRVAAYHFFVFPATFLDVYPWGLALSAVQPLGCRKTRVCFRTFVSNRERRPQSALGGMRRRAAEDGEKIMRVQAGLSSSLYQGGRYAPGMETCVHHFHRLLSSWLAGGKGVR